MENSNYIAKKDYGNVAVVENKSYQWAVIDNRGNFIVPFGKYGWIDGFDSGLARVRTATNAERARESASLFFNLPANRVGVVCKEQPNPANVKWGIINESGEEALPVVYDNIWNFLGKNRHSTRVEKGGYEKEVFFSDLNPSLSVHANDSQEEYYDDDYPYDEPGWGSYDEYGGYNGYDDYTIDSAFDGDPEATWNID